MNLAKPEEAFGDAVTQPFWAGAERRQLMIQRCGQCGGHQFYPRRFCRSCHAEAVDWVAASGLGQLRDGERVTVARAAVPAK